MTEAVLAAQIGRPLRAESVVVASCHLGLPVVAEVPPVLDDGTPFPTRYWLTCPLAVRRIGRLEGSGGVKQMERWVEVAAAERFAAANERYAAERDALVPPDAIHRPDGGVAGTKAGVKCLHAHYADHAAGNDNPVGEVVAPWVEPLDCQSPCVVGESLNPDWREP